MTMPRLISERSYDDITYRTEGGRKDSSGSLSPFTFLCISLVLTLMGLVSLYSASYAKAVDLGLPHYWFFMRQAIVAAVSLGVGAVFTLIPRSALEKGYLLFIPLSLALLVLQLIPGFFYAGSLVIGGYRIIQAPSVALLGIIFTISCLLPEKDEAERRVVKIVMTVISTSVLLVLSLLVGGISWYFLASVLTLLLLRRRSVGKIALFFVLLFMLVTGGTIPVLLPSLLSPLFSSVLPVSDPSLYDAALTASVGAISDGGIAGVGLGSGVYKLGVLPSPESQFIFAAFVEELGLAGAAFLVLMFVLFLIIGIRTSKRGMGMEREKSATLAFGLTLMVVLKALCNMLYVSGLLPLPGILMPFFSYSLSEEAVTILSSVMLYRLVYMMGREAHEAS